MQWLLLIILIPYIYILLRVYFSLTNIRPYIPAGDPEIFVSVIIPCRNEEKNLPSLLDDISAEDYSKDLFEVIVVDDNSEDKTIEVAAKYKSVFKNLKILKNSGKGKKSAIRTGVSSSSGNLIITTDADCRVGCRWISTIASFYKLNKPALIICPVRLESKPGFFNRFQELEFLSLQGITAGSALMGNPVMCNGANLAFTKEAFTRNSSNLRDELPTGDDVFLLHAIKKEPGSKISWLESQEAAVTTRASEDLKSFMKQRSRWISKSGAYRDAFTLTLEIVTFVTILMELFLLVAGLFYQIYLLILLVTIIVKSIPDFMILKKTTERYNRKPLIKMFLPGEIIYPVYIISLCLRYYLSRIKRKS